ncbi:MAG: arginine--tRNA ligase, partial [Acidobacteriota bacterium]
KSMVAYRRFADGATPESAGIKSDHFVGHWYVEFNKALDAERNAWLDEQEITIDGLDEQAKKKVEERFLAASELMIESRDVLVRWEAEDEAIRALWRTMNQWVYDGFDQTYDRLGIHFDKHYYESDIYQGGRRRILDAVDRGVFEKAPNGAILAPLSKHEERLGRKLQDKVVLRADGTGLYITQDLNLAGMKFEEFGLSRSLHCIGSEQQYYMQQLAATLKLLGFEWADEVIHLSYGMVYLPEGKMKSREGQVVDADDLMAEVTRLAAEAVRERSSDLDEAEVARRGEAIGLGAIVFDMLIVGRETEIHFDPRASVAFEGKTGPYLQYAYARISSILRDAGEWQAPEALHVEAAAEWPLVAGLLAYPAAVAEASDTLDPARLTNFLIEQAQAFNRFYRDCRVLKAEEPVRSSRLALLAAFRTMLGHGLSLLAIESLDVM